MRLNVYTDGTKQAEEVFPDVSPHPASRVDHGLPFAALLVVGDAAIPAFGRVEILSAALLVDVQTRVVRTLEVPHLEVMSRPGMLSLSGPPLGDNCCCCCCACWAANKAACSSIAAPKAACCCCAACACS